MHPELITFGNVTLYSYGTMIALGFLAATWWAYRHVQGSGFKVQGSRFKVQGSTNLELRTLNVEPKPEDILSLVIWVIVSGVIGARLFYVIQFWSQFQGRLWQIFNIRGGGLVFYGGLISGFMAICVYCYRHKLSLWKVLDIAAPAIMLGYAFGRVGCFLNGCCVGRPTFLPWGLHFPHFLEARHPTQLYASLTALTIFGALTILWKHKRYDGQVFSQGLVLHSMYRFFIEFIRENPLYRGLSAAQWIALGLIIIVMAARIPGTKTLKH